MSFRRAWRVCSWCTRQGFRLSLWTTWVLLIAALASLGYLLSARRVTVPDPVRRVIEQRLAAQGLHLVFAHARMDLAGRFIFDDVRLRSARADTLLTARSVYVRLDSLDLLTGQLHVEEVRVGGLDLHLPPELAGEPEPSLPANNIDFGLLVDGREITLSYLTGYIGRLPVTASGNFHAPPPVATDKTFEHSVDRITASYLAIAKNLRAADAWLRVAESPRLDLRLTPTAINVDLRADALDLRSLPGGPEGTLSQVRLRTVLPVNGPVNPSLGIRGSVRSATLPAGVTANDLEFRLMVASRGASGFDARQLELQLSSLRRADIEAGPLAATILQPSIGLYTADISLGLAGSAWRVQGDAHPATGVAHVHLDGFIGDATLAFAGTRIGRDLGALLDPVVASPLHVSASFGPDWKLHRVTGRLHSGAVRVGGAFLDETGAEFTYDGTRVLCDNLVLRQGPSLAHGSYEMDTRTLDFRFLLTGGLIPEGIESWFHAWWGNFWRTFDFSRGLPVADVDVRGRWGDLTATRVFVQAEAANTGLKGVDFDRVRTRLFLRPHWFDILHFNVLRDEHTAAGWLTRSLDLEKDTWRHMEFSVDSTLPLGTISTLFKAESAELLAPYAFTSPPRMRLAGRVDSAASPAGKNEHIDITLVSSGPMTYHDFPLSDLTFEARVRNDDIELPALVVGFAEGKANGHARLWKQDEQRRLKFDVALADANLGTTIHAIAALQPASAESATAKPDASASQRQQRLERGRLAFSLAAEGLLADFHSFHGIGRAAITGAELAQLNLFGPLSEALSGTRFSFGSFSLTTVEAPFALEGEKVHFEDLRVTGPSALLQAKGNYHLPDSRLDFAAKIHPFDESESVVSNAVGFMLSPLSKMFEVKLQGTLAKPKWIFAYGPSRLLNTLSGVSETPLPSATPAPAPAPSPAPSLSPEESEQN